MGGNLPPGVTAADIDRHFGPGCEHEFHEPDRVEADEVLAVYQGCRRTDGSRVHCEMQRVTYYDPDHVEVIGDGEEITVVGYEDVWLDTWPEDVWMAAEWQVNDPGVEPYPYQFYPGDDEVSVWVELDDCPIDHYPCEYRVVYSKRCSEIHP